MRKKSRKKLLKRLDDIVAALNRLAPPPEIQSILSDCDCFVWEPEARFLQPIARVNRVDLSVLRGIDHEIGRAHV